MKKYITLLLNISAIYVSMFNIDYLNYLFISLLIYFLIDCFLITDNLMKLHHISASLVIIDYFLNSYESDQLNFAINILVKGEISSIFLSLRQIVPSKIIDILFVLTFLYFRTINLLIAIWSENFFIYLLNGSFPALKVSGIFSLYFLNYYWTFLILRKIF